MTTTPKRPVWLAEILQATCDVYGLPYDALRSHRGRSDLLAEARSVYSYVALSVTNLSLPVIAHMGGMSHSTIQYGNKKAMERMGSNRESCLAAGMKLAGVVNMVAKQAHELRDEHVADPKEYERQMHLALVPRWETK